MKRRTLYGLELLVLCLGLAVLQGVLKVVFTDHTAGLIAYGLWLAAVVVVGHYANLLRYAQLRRLWGLADELGYGPKRINEKAPRYSAAQWQQSRPENAAFFPSDRVVAQLCDEFTLEVAERSGVL